MWLFSREKARFVHFGFCFFFFEKRVRVCSQHDEASIQTFHVPFPLHRKTKVVTSGKESKVVRFFLQKNKNNSEGKKKTLLPEKTCSSKQKSEIGKVDFGSTKVFLSVNLLENTEGVLSIPIPDIPKIQYVEKNNNSVFLSLKSIYCPLFGGRQVCLSLTPCCSVSVFLFFPQKK